MYTMEMVFTPAEDEELVGEVNFELKKNPDGSVGAVNESNWDSQLTNKLLNLLRDYPAVKRLEFSIEEEG